MPVVRPFRAVRPAKAFVKQTISLPYDVMSREEAKEMAEGNEKSFLHITRSEIDLPDDVDAYDKEVYEKARTNLDSFIDKGILIRESKPMLYIYRQTMNGKVQTGIVGCVSVEDYENKKIKKHEFTRVEKEVDRINHFDFCNANTEPVFLTYRDNAQIKKLTDTYAKTHEKEYDLVTEDGIRHEFWAISDDNVSAGLTGLFNVVPSFYIADGHHRTESAYKVSKKIRERVGSYSGDEEFNYFMAVIFPDTELNLMDYNRVVKDLNGLSVDEFLNAVGEKFDVVKKGKEQYKPTKKHDIAMYLNNEWYSIVAKDSIISDDTYESLDVSILQANVLNPLLDIKDPRTSDRIDFIGGIRGYDELEKKCNDGVAFGMYPMDISDLFKLSDEELVAPPKSTWFEPKLGSGLFVHEL